jgi:hypothetical protein
MQIQAYLAVACSEDNKPHIDLDSIQESPKRNCSDTHDYNLSASP